MTTHRFDTPALPAFGSLPTVLVTPRKQVLEAPSSRERRITFGTAWARSSNYLELANLVETFERYSAEQTLQDTELFMFTDNTVAEVAFFHGTSSSKVLFDLVLRLRKVELESGVLLDVIHVAGTRMIRQGADGLSRGNTLEGVLGGNT